MENRILLKEALEHVGLLVEEKDQFTLVVHHPWKDNLSKAINKNRMVYDIAVKFSPAIVKPINELNATLIKL